MASEIIESMRWRYATKKFDRTKILSEEKLNTVKSAFNLTATSYGLQPLKMLIVSNQDLKEKLVPITMDQQQVNEASHVLVFCIEKQMNASYIKDHFNRVQQIRNTSRKILDPFESFLIESFSNKEGSEITEWMTNQAYLSMGNLLTVCAIENIDACPIEGFEPDKYDELLQLEDKGLKSVLVMAIGYRADDDMFADFKKVRRGVEEVIIEVI